MNEPRIILSLDTDCGNEDVVKNTIDILLGNYINKFTIFATENFYIFNTLPPTVEIGLHPYISSISEAEEKISSLKNTFPLSVSLRNHTLFNSARLFPIYNRQGIRATSNYLSFLSKNITPIRLPYDINEYPIYFMDDAYIILYNHPDKFSVGSLKLNSPGLKVLTFHPIHIFLNTNDLAQYSKSKNNFNNIRKLKRNINKNKGIKNLFIDTLQYIKKEQMSIFTFSELL